MVEQGLEFWIQSRFEIQSWANLLLFTPSPPTHATTAFICGGGSAPTAAEDEGGWQTSRLFCGWHMTFLILWMLQLLEILPPRSVLFQAVFAICCHGEMHNTTAYVQQLLFFILPCWQQKMGSNQMPFTLWSSNCEITKNCASFCFITRFKSKHWEGCK